MNTKFPSLLLVLAGLAFAPAAWAKTCAVTITGTDQMSFDQTQIKVAADCTEVAVTLKHSGKLAAAVMGHNWVLTKTPDFQAVANAGTSSSLADNYLPKNDPRIIAHTKVIGAGQSDTVKFSTAKLSKGGDYTFFCSFPGHWAVMKGKFVFG